MKVFVTVLYCAEPGHGPIPFLRLKQVTGRDEDSVPIDTVVQRLFFVIAPLKSDGIPLELDGLVKDTFHSGK